LVAKKYVAKAIGKIGDTSALPRLREAFDEANSKGLPSLTAIDELKEAIQILEKIENSK